MRLFRPYRSEDRAAEPEATATSPEPTEDVAGARARGPRRKDGPTPSRRDAEAARRERVRPTLSKKEARARVTQQRREARLSEMAARDNTPEKALLRDVIDTRWNLTEFMLPAMILMLALSMLERTVPALSLGALVAMYGFLALAVLDYVLLWRRFKKLLAARHPRSSSKGLAFYGLNRAIQIRRLRMPPPRLKRGEKV